MEECNPFTKRGDFQPAKCRSMVPFYRYTERLHSCTSTRQCFLVWHFFTLIAEILQHTPSVSALFGLTPTTLQTSLEGLHYWAFGRGKHWAEAAAWAWENTITIADALRPDKVDEYSNGRPILSKRSAVLVHFAASSPAAAAKVQPFIDLLRCFAERQGMNFVYDRAAHVQFTWLRWRYETLSLPNSYTLGLSRAAASPTPSSNVSLPFVTFLNKYFETTQPDLSGKTKAMLQAISPEDVWSKLEEHLGVINGNPLRWAKVWSIQDAIEKHEAVVFFDYDVTVRPDCLGAVRLLEELFTPNEGGTVPHLVVRDSPFGVDCFNSGFLAIRNTPVARLMLKMWKDKMQWPGVLHGDQGAFAETILEVLDLEHRLLNSKSPDALHSAPGYTQQCIVFLFPDTRGMTSWSDYCECFQFHANKMVGLFGRRQSTFIRFLNPMDVDVNYIPNSLTPAHSQSLRKMRLLPWRPGGGLRPRSIKTDPVLPPFTPLVVHWAGLRNRTRLMKNYLMQRFGLTPGWFNMGRDAADRCAAIAPLSPRVHAACARGAMDSRIHRVFQDWNFVERLDNNRRSQEAEAAVTATFDSTLRRLTADMPNSLETASLPDREVDAWTMSTRFRSGLVEALGGRAATREMVAVEIGAYFGYTTRFLAWAFRGVIGVERVPEHAQKARQLLVGQTHATIMQLDTFTDDWGSVVVEAQSFGGADIVLIDGDHAYEAVLNDLFLALFGGLGPQNGRPRYVALDDYPSRAEVFQAVADFVHMGLLRVGTKLGNAEGVLCEVIKHGNEFSS